MNPAGRFPNWDWAPGSELQLPAPFRVTTSPLYTPNRNLAINNGTGSLNPLAVSISSAFSNTNFLTTNLIIQNPHGNVHFEVGGSMCCVPTAALDPIFYLHHANVDRQWNLWLAQGGGRTDPLWDATWKTRQYTFFDENGGSSSISEAQNHGLRSGWLFCIHASKSARSFSASDRISLTSDAEMVSARS